MILCVAWLEKLGTCEQDAIDVDEADMPSESEKSDDADEVTVTMYGVTSVIKNRRYQAVHVDVDWSQFDQLSLIKDIDYKERRRRKRERVVVAPAAASAEGDIIMEEADQSRRVPTQQEEQQSRRVPTTAGEEDDEIEVMASRRDATAMEVEEEVPRDSDSGSQTMT